MKRSIIRQIRVADQSPVKKTICFHKQKEQYGYKQQTERP